MTTTELLNKWHKLNTEKQAKVLAFINTISEEKPEVISSENSEQMAQPQTELGKKLWEIRQKIINDSHIPLLTLDEIESELDEIRGKTR